MRIAALLMILAVPAAVAGDRLEPTFYLSFDSRVKPEVCAAGTSADIKGQLKFVPGKKGKAILIGEGCSLAFPTKGNLKKDGGTIAVWVKHEDPKRERPKYARIFEMFLPAQPHDGLLLLYPNHSLVNGVVKSGGKKWTSWPLGEATVFGEKWQHYALTWGEDGAAFFMNGVTLSGSVSMPQLSGLGDLFFVGCDREGQFPACTAIDELYIFDRPLRSHELCQIAGIPAGTNLSKPNLLRNSSFEVGQDEWIIFPRSDFHSVVSIDETEAFHGQHSLLIDRRRAEGKSWSSIVVVGPWVHLDEGLDVTFSAYMKSDAPGTKARMTIQRGTQNRTIENVPEAGEISRYLTVGTEWKRCSVSGKLALAYKDGYRPMLFAMTMGSRLWVDALQLSVGGEREYEPFADMEIGGETGRKDALFDLGEEVSPHAYVFNNRRTFSEAVVEYRMENPYGSLILDGQVTDRIPSGSRWNIELPRFVPALRGQYRLELALKDGDLLTDKRQYAFGVIKSHLRTPSPETSPFGVHGSPGEKGRRIGIKQLRDVGGMNWKWLEPRKGDDQTAFIEQNLKLDQQLGYVHVKTLAQAPKWASMKGTDGIPASIEEWQGYVRKVVAQFKPYVKTWEIWNEPNLNDYFKDHPDYYVKLLEAARKTAKEADPECRIIGLCLAGVGKSYGTPWLQKIFELGALHHMDGISLHLYRDEPPEKAGFVEALREVKEMMAKHGGVKPMYLTEFGVGGTEDRRLFIPWYCGSRKWNEEEEAALFVRTNVLSLAEGAKYLYWYKWLCERQQVGPDTFGFFRPDAFYTPKKLVLAYNELIWQLEAAIFDSKIETRSPAQHVYAFHGKGGWDTVMWDENGHSQLLAEAEGMAKLFDIWGNAAQLQSRTNSMTVSLSQSPVYLVTASRPVIRTKN